MVATLWVDCKRAGQNFYISLSTGSGRWQGISLFVYTTVDYERDRTTRTPDIEEGLE